MKMSMSMNMNPDSWKLWHEDNQTARRSTEEDGRLKHTEG